MQQKDDALYSRGRYRLEWDRRGDGSLRTPYLQIIWYDDAARRNKSRSTGTADVAEAEFELDKFFLQRERGQAVCETCGQPLQASRQFPLSQSINDYLVARAEVSSSEALGYRAAHFLDFMAAEGCLEVHCDQVDEDLIGRFRKWSAKQPVVIGKGENRKVRARAPGTTEASVTLVAAAINLSAHRKDTLHRASFAAKQASEVSQTPQYRADVATLIRMFAYATQKRVKFRDMFPQRVNLLKFLQLSVASWARPDAVYDFSTDPARGQWVPAAHVAVLNPKGRVQTKKYRPSVPIAHQVAELLTEHQLETPGYFIPTDDVRKAFETMVDKLGLPRDGESGEKLIRRSISNIVRKRIGEERWRQGEIMLGHQKTSTSDLYALFDPANLGLALKATEAVIDEITAVVPDAFTPLWKKRRTGNTPELRMIRGGRNG